MSLSKRKGFIRFSDNPINWIDKDALKEIFSRFFPTHIEHKFMSVEYFGYSDYFEEVEEGCVINEYVIEITTDDIGNYSSIKFIKQ